MDGNYNDGTELQNSSAWNQNQEPDLMQQTGPGYTEQRMWDDLDKSINQPSQYKRYSNKSLSRYNWAHHARKKTISAREVAIRFFDALNLSNTTDEQDDILLHSIQYGTNSAGCMSGEDMVSGYEWRDITMLESIEADEGWEEEVLVEVLQNGLMGRGGGFINTPSRRWHKDELYRHLDKIIDQHDTAVEQGRPSEFERLTDGIIDLWLEKISENDNLDTPEGSEFVCYNGGKLNISAVFDNQFNYYGEPIQKKYINMSGEPIGDAFTFEELADQYGSDTNWQAVVDDWDGKGADGETKRIWSDREKQQMGGRKRRLTFRK